MLPLTISTMDKNALVCKIKNKTKNTSLSKIHLLRGWILIFNCQPRSINLTETSITAESSSNFFDRAWCALCSFLFFTNQLNRKSSWKWGIFVQNSHGQVCVKQTEALSVCQSLCLPQWSRWRRLVPTSLSSPSSMPLPPYTAHTPRSSTVLATSSWNKTLPFSMRTNQTPKIDHIISHITKVCFSTSASAELKDWLRRNCNSAGFTNSFPLELSQALLIEL